MSVRALEGDGCQKAETKALCHRKRALAKSRYPTGDDECTSKRGLSGDGKKVDRCFKCIL